MAITWFVVELLAGINRIILMLQIPILPIRYLVVVKLNLQYIIQFMPQINLSSNSCRFKLRKYNMYFHLSITKCTYQPAACEILARVPFPSCSAVLPRQLCLHWPVSFGIHWKDAILVNKCFPRKISVKSLLILYSLHVAQLYRGCYVCIGQCHSVFTEKMRYL